MCWEVEVRRSIRRQSSELEDLDVVTLERAGGVTMMRFGEIAL